MLNPSERNFYAELAARVGPAAALRYQTAVMRGEFWEPLAKELYDSVHYLYRWDLWYIMQMVAFGYVAKSPPDQSETGDYIGGR